MLYLKLFFSFFQVGLFSFGGGYASMPMIQEQVVTKHGWLTATEFVDLITISQMTPGPIAINSSTFVGIRIAGFWGAIVATLGCILPSLVIVLLLVWIYQRYQQISVVQGILNGLRPVVIALIASAGMSIATLVFWNSEEFSLSLGMPDGVACLLFFVSLAVLRSKKVDVIIVMLLSGIVGGVLYGL